MVYDMAMSVGDNALRAFTFGKIGTLGGLLSAGAVGGQVMGSTIDEYMQKGASNKQALFMGALAGGCEALGEAVDMSTLMKLSDPAALAKSALNGGKALTPTKMIKSYLLTNAVTETGSEMVTELATYVADMIVMSDRAEVLEIYNTAKSEGKTNGQAFFSVVGKVAADIGIAGLGGLVSGLILGGGNLALEMNSIGKSKGARIGSRMSTGARTLIDNINANAELQNAFSEKYQEILADGTAADTTARVQMMDDIHALGLDGEMTEAMNQIADKFASSPADLISPKAMQALTAFQEAVHKAASSTQIIDADANTRKTKAQQKLGKLYEAVGNYQREAAAALQAGDLGAHTKALDKLRMAISAYNSATEIAQAENAAETLKEDIARKDVCNGAKGTAQVLRSIADEEAEYQLNGLTETVGDAMNRLIGLPMDGTARAGRALRGGASVSDAMSMLLNSSAQASTQPVNDSTISQTAEGEAVDGSAYGAVDGREGQRSEARADGVRVGEPGRNNVHTTQRADAGGFRERDGANRPGVAQDIRARQVAALDTWDASSTKSVIARMVAEYNAKRRKGSPRLDIASITPAAEPSDAALDANEKAQKFLGGQKTLLFHAAQGKRAPFGATFDGREYVRDTGGDLVAFHKGHERAHNRVAYRNAGQAALKALGGQEGGMFQRYLDKVDEHPQLGAEREQAQTEFLCDVFGAYVYGKATGKSVADRLGLTDVEASVFFRVFDDAMSGQVLEESDETTDNKKVTLSEHDVSEAISAEEIERIKAENERYANSFVSEYRKWDKTSDVDPFDVGTTPIYLKNEGVPERRVLFWMQDINHLKNEHPAMTDDIIEQIPSVVNDPVVVMESRTVPGSRYTVFGEAYDKNGIPVLVVLDVDPNPRKGYDPNTIRIANAYGKDKKAQWFIDNSKIVHQSPDMKKVQRWSVASGLQLPSSTISEPISKIAYAEAKSNMRAEENSQSDFSTHDLGPADTKTPSKQTAALDLYDRGMSVMDYWQEASADGAYNVAIAKELRGIEIRNGRAVGGAIGQQELDSLTENSGRWKQIPRVQMGLMSPGRLFENVVAWRTGRVASDEAANYVEGKRFREKYPDYGQAQMANKALWMREERAKIAAAYEKGDVRVSVLSQLMGERVIGRSEAENALYDKDHLVVQKDGGVLVFDMRGRISVLSDGQQTVIYDENYRKRLREANKAINEILLDKNMTDNQRSAAIADLTQSTKALVPIRDMPVSVERKGQNVTVRDGSGNVIAEIRQGKQVDIDHVERVTEALRDFYARAYQVQNQTLIENGYPPLGYIADYFPHQGRIDTGLNAFIKSLKGENLPTPISGRTADFKPGKPWMAHVLERTGTTTEYDAIRGFNRYVQAAGDLIYSTPVVQRLRQLERQLRDTDPFSKNNAAFVSWLRNYGNIFANKKSFMDRGMEDETGRLLYTISDKLTGLVSASAIGANPRSALSNVVSFLNSIPTLEAKQIGPAIKATVRNMIAGADNSDGFADSISFLANRQNSYKEIQTNTLGRMKQTGSDILYWMFETMDQITSEATARAKYAELREKGFTEEQAAQKTSSYCMDVYADRTKGANATLFNSKLVKPFMQYQMEVLNQLSHFRDIRQQGISEQIDKLMLENDGTLDGIDITEMGKEIHAGGVKDIGRMIAYLLLMSLWGGFTRWAWRDDQTWNPVGMAVDAANDYKDGGMQAALTGLGETAADQLPFASTLSGGRIPVAAGAENLITAWKNPISGNTDSAGENALKAALSVTPGGGQLNRMIQGAKAVKEGGNYTASGNLRYPIESGGNKVRSVLFGPSAAAPEGYQWGKDVLTEKETKAYQEARPRGVEDFDMIDYLVNGYNAGDTKAEQLLSLAIAKPPADEVDIIAEVLGLDYSGSLKQAARKEAKKYKAKKDVDPETIARIDEMMAILVGK